MPQTRKLVRTAMRTALADLSDGFNAEIAAVSGTYGIEPFLIDWEPASTTFLQSNLDRAATETSRLITGIKVALYTSESSQQSGSDTTKLGSMVFQGLIRAHLDFTVEYADGIELTEEITEDISDAIEDSVLRVLVDPDAKHAELFRGEGPIYYAGDFACARLAIEQTEGGFSQLLPFTFLYEVHV